MGKDTINLHKLGRFVAISQSYPFLIAKLEDNPELLDELQRIVIGASPKPAEGDAAYWANRPRLMKLLGEHLGTKLSESNKDEFALMNINIGKLLQVAPSIEATAAAAMAPKSSQPSEKSTLAA